MITASAWESRRPLTLTGSSYELCGLVTERVNSGYTDYDLPHKGRHTGSRVTSPSSVSVEESCCNHESHSESSARGAGIVTQSLTTDELLIPNRFIERLQVLISVQLTTEMMILICFKLFSSLICFRGSEARSPFESRLAFYPQASQYFPFSFKSQESEGSFFSTVTKFLPPAEVSPPQPAFCTGGSEYPFPFCFASRPLESFASSFPLQLRRLFEAASVFLSCEMISSGCEMISSCKYISTRLCISTRRPLYLYT
eukprot:g12924.t1